MITKTPATLDELYQIPGNMKAELVHGELIHMSPTGFLPNYAASEIYVSLRDYARRTKLARLRTAYQSRLCGQRQCRVRG